MSLKVFSNEEGKILTSIGGRIVKQPYEFGNAFQNRMGLNNYFEVNGINLPANWSYIAIANLAADTPLIQTISTSLNLADNLSFRGGTLGINFSDYIDSINYITNTSSRRNTTIRYGYSDSTYFTVLIESSNNILSLINVNTTRVESVRDKIRIAAGRIYTQIGNGTGIISYMHSADCLNRIYIFNRPLSIGELNYCYNNGLYSVLQSTQGLIHDWKFNNAEVINISGTDKPAVRDLVGIAHLEMINLPAGTAQQKVDYANANLFVPFLT